MSKSNADNCYICLEKIKNPVYPAGCNHGFCKEHLKVNIYILHNFNNNLGNNKIRMWNMPFTF